MGGTVELARTIHSGWERGDWSAIGRADPEIGIVIAFHREREARDAGESAR